MISLDRSAILSLLGISSRHFAISSRHFVFEGVRSDAGGAGEVVIASSKLTLSPAFTPSRAVGGKWSFIEPSGVFTSIHPRLASTFVTRPSIMWRPAAAAGALVWASTADAPNSSAAAARPAGPVCAGTPGAAKPISNAATTAALTIEFLMVSSAAPAGPESWIVWDHRSRARGRVHLDATAPARKKERATPMPRARF